MNELDHIIEQLQRQRSAIDHAVEALRGFATPETKARRGRPKPAQGGLSAAGRKALSENMRERWAAKRTADRAKKATRKRRAKPA